MDAFDFEPGEIITTATNLYNGTILAFTNYGHIYRIAVDPLDCSVTITKLA